MKYKLIKKYPSLPPDWREGMIVSLGKHGFYVPESLNLTQTIIKKTEVLHSEYWEEMIDKDYEILKYLSPGKIHSVKRVSDGVIFTVGDRVETTSNKYGDHIFYLLNKVYSIREIKIAEDSTSLPEYNSPKKLNSVYLGLHKSNNWVNINDVTCRKDDKPIFTTEDNVEIFKGNTYYKVNSKFKIRTKVCKSTFSGDSSNCKSKYFKNRKNALDYIVENKKCLSVKDTYDILQNVSFTYKDGIIKNEIMENLRKLVRSNKV